MKEVRLITLKLTELKNLYANGHDCSVNDMELTDVEVDMQSGEVKLTFEAEDNIDKLQ
jgi:hypothetical protein